jgi:hypothetical protein
MVVEGSARTRRSLARRGRAGATLDCPAVYGLIASVATLAAVLGATAAAPAGARTAPDPSVPACALGTSGPDMRGFAGPALARAERRFAGRPRARRAFAAGVAAYLYGRPPLSVGLTVARLPANEMVSIARLADPTIRTVVAPNRDTTYTVAHLDLSQGPLVIDVPNTRGRYYVLQLLDAYSNTFGYIGRRTTGTRAGSFALVPPGYGGSLPAGVRRIESRTPLVWLLGRTLVRDEGEIPAVTPLLAGYRVTPLASWSAGVRRPAIVLPRFPPGQTSITLPGGLDFFDSLGAFLRRNPPPARDACALRAFAAAGIGPGRTPSTEATGAARAGLEAAPRAGARLVSAAVRRANAYSRRRNNGWLVPPSYIGAYGRNYLGRAVVARFALGANTRAETVYPAAFTDGRGRPLSGAHRYRLRFERGELPPVGAFWSVTMYEGDYLYPNPLRRYAIGDRTRGLRRGRDGSLTLFIQHRAPRGAARSNWLPAPRRRFRLIMRLYEPRRPVLTGAWRPPPLRRR